MFPGAILLPRRPRAILERAKRWFGFRAMRIVSRTVRGRLLWARGTWIRVSPLRGQN